MAAEARGSPDARGDSFAFASGGMDAHVILLSFFIGSYSISRDVFFRQLVFEFETYILKKM